MNPLLSFLASIRWQDIVDVVFNSYILFRLYVIFRGTNVIRVLAGLALLWVFQRMTVALGLIVTSWAMQGIITGAALIIIIVFRNEIRNVLQAKNLRALLWGVPQKSSRTPIDALVEGVYELARKRIGALIVLPGKEGLEDAIQGGTPWGGLVSKEMLVSIFWNGNPVHDGAAVIQGDRVTSVGAILPLSTRDDLPQYYGTRHRAAAGLAERTDALVIVVSEERCKVVAVQNDTVTRVDDNLRLRQLLADHLGLGGQDTAGVRRERRELLVAAVISVLCMGSIWFSFAKGMETLTSIEVPLEYMNRDAKMQIVSTSVNTVRLHLSGSSALINTFRPDQVKAKLDLSKAIDGQNVFTLTAANIVVPPGLRLNRIEPPEVQVSLDLPQSKHLPVQVNWVGTLPAGLILESATVIPDQVMVAGPQRALDQIATLYTEKINLSELQGSGRLTVKLALNPADVKLAGDFKREVQVSYTIGKRKE
ncbi:MAG: DisA protein [Desulfatitalea sp.]|nr:diadenylate cyclase [Desulfatitalea sp.]NNK01478.1 DisA protein [Desulfatitalea sp.]